MVIVGQKIVCQMMVLSQLLNYVRCNKSYFVIVDIDIPKEFDLTEEEEDEIQNPALNENAKDCWEELGLENFITPTFVVTSNTNNASNANGNSNSN